MEELTRFMVAFQEEYPEVVFDIYTATADDVKERMDNGLTDLGLLMEPVEITRYNFLRMPRKERWCVLLRKDSPLAEKSVITPADLQGQRLIMTKRKSVQNELENWLGKYYDQIKVVATSNLSYYNRSMMVKNNFGIATCHEFQNAYEELCLRPLEPEISNGSVLIWKKAQVFSPAVIKFIEFVRNLL